MVWNIFILSKPEIFYNLMPFLNTKEIFNERGFTLLEAMVTIGIISIMSAVYLVNYRTTNQKIILDQVASSVVSDLRNVQNMSMNVKLFNGAIPEGGYGIKINNTTPASYTIYADCDNDHLYGLSSTCGTSADKPEKVNDRTLDSNVVITPVLDVAFQPPNPIVWFNGLNTGTYVDIFLQYGSNTSGRKIRINRLTGQISVSNIEF